MRLVLNRWLWVQVGCCSVCRASEYWIYLYSPKQCAADGDPAWYIPEITFSGNHQLTAAPRGLQAQTRVKTVPTGGLRDKLGYTEVWRRGYLDRSRKWDEPSGNVNFQPPASSHPVGLRGFDSYRTTSRRPIDAVGYKYL